MCNVKMEEMWIEKIARVIGLEKFAKRLTGKDGLGPYMLILIFFVVDFLDQIISFVKYGWCLWLRMPLMYGVLYMILLYCIFAIIWIKENYYKTIYILKKNRVLPRRKSFNTLIPKDLKLSLLVIGLILLILRIRPDVMIFLENPSVVGVYSFQEMIIFRPGIIHGIVTILTWIFFFLPLTVEFVSMFVAVHSHFLYQLKKTKIKFIFEDTKLFGGLEPVGRLFVQSTLSYYLGLTLALLLTWSSGWNFGIYSTSFFIGMWIFGFIMFFVPLLPLHRHMIQAKQKKLEEIRKDLVNLLSKKEDSTDTSIEDLLKSIQQYMILSYVEKFREYPFNIYIIRDLLFAAVIPIFAEITVRLLLNL